MPTSEKEAHAVWQLALQLVKARGLRSGPTWVHQIDDRLTIAFTPAADDRPNGLDIFRHSEGAKVMNVIWADDGTPPIVVVYRGGPWVWILKRAVALAAKTTEGG